MYNEALEIFDKMMGLPEYRGEQRGYDLHYYSHGAGICALLKLIECNPVTKSFTFMTKKGLHSNARELYEFQKYFSDFFS